MAMVKIKNVGCEEFKKDEHSKKVYFWGAGRRASLYVRFFCKDLDLIAVVDTNDALDGNTIKVDDAEYPIISEKRFLEQLRGMDAFKDRVVIFVTSTIYAAEIIKHLNQILLLDGLPCYVGSLMKDVYEPMPFTFSNGDEKIPKKIHYCWFGGSTIPDKLQRCMDSWRKYCPDYEIMRWDEDNYDISKNRYMREAYECKHWGFVSDYARLDIIYHEGGIYLDTDVELLAPLDKLLRDDMFCGFADSFRINTGCGFGAVKGHPLIKKLRDYYDGFSFYLDDGRLNLKTCDEYQRPVLQEFGFRFVNRYQKKEGVVVYPSEVLAPDNGIVEKNYTENTVSIHHSAFSWVSEKEKQIFELGKKELKRMVSV